MISLLLNYLVSIAQTLKFKAVLLDRSMPLNARRQLLQLQIVKDLAIPEVDLACDDVLFNSVTSES